MWIGSIPGEKSGIGESGWVYVHGEKHVLSLAVKSDSGGPFLPFSDAPRKHASIYGVTVFGLDAGILWS